MSRLSHVFLFDSDAKGRDTLVYGLEGDAVSVRASDLGDDARAALRVTPVPEVIVVVLREGDRQGPSLLRFLGENPALAPIPRLVLAAAESLPTDLQVVPGPQSFIPLPAYVRDVITAAKLIGAGAGREGDAEHHLSGALSDFGLLFIVRTMVGLRRSGIVSVERDSRKGEIRFASGELISAQVGSREGISAVHQLLLWEEAKLEMTFRSLPTRATSLPQGEALLEDLERFLREFDSATKNIGQAQSLFVQDSEKVAASVDAIAAEIIPVMKLFDGQRNLGDVLEDSQFQAFETLGTVSRLIELGMIRRKAIEKPSTGLVPGARKPRPEVADWVNRGADAPVMKPGAAGGGRPAPSAGSTAATSSASPADPGSGSVQASGADPGSGPGGTAEQRTAIGHRRRSRRRTGEVPATPDNPLVSTVVPTGPPVRTTAAPQAPATTPSSPATAPAASAELRSPTAPASPVPSPSPAPPPNGKPVFVRPPGQQPGEQQEVHGELRAVNKERSITPLTERTPKILVDLGPAETAEIDPAARSAEAIPVPILEENNLASPTASSPASPNSLGDTQPIVSKSSPAAPPAAEAIPTPLRESAGVRSAEIDTGLRPAPAPELLEAPPSGPSIMLDPRLVAEMDAFELANTAATPPPQLIAEPPPPAPPAPPAPEPPRPAAPAAGGAIVSFVKGPANASPHPGMNSAPTVPMSPVTTAGHGGGAVPTAQSAGGTPAEGVTRRRASGEFNEIEADFFAREADLYSNANEPAESFDDLEQAGGTGEKPGGFDPKRKS